MSVRGRSNAHKSAVFILPTGSRTMLRHRISILAEATRLRLAKDQKVLLRTVESFIVWAGRYPISMNRHQFALPQQFRSGDQILLELAVALCQSNPLTLAQAARLADLDHIGFWCGFGRLVE